MSANYIIITPVRDEEQYIESTIRSVLGQTVLPREWIIVDDGSTDRTGEIVERYAMLHDWIRLVRRSDRGYRKSGAGVVEAFHQGYANLQSKTWEFIVKLDADLSFAPQYFAQLFERFEIDPKLGIAGGNLFHLVNGEMKLEKCPRFHVRGATKVYRRQCWEQIGGLVTAPGWDIVDETKANMLGWKTVSFEDIQVIHHRFTGTAESKWRDQVKNGKAYYVAGYHPLFMAAKCVYRVASKPYVVGSVAMAYGFLSGYFHKPEQSRDRKLVEYVRRQQLRRLCGSSTIWK